MIESVLDRIEKGLFTSDFRVPSRIDGYYVFPGFVDSHAHMAEHGYFMRFPSLDKIGSKKELLDVIAASIDRTKDINIFVDYDESVFEDEKNIEKADLERITQDVPLMLRRVCGHVAVLNSKAIQYFEEKLGRGFIDKNTGMAYEYIPLHLYDILNPSLEEIKEGILLAQQRYLKKGITGVGDFAKDFKVFLAYREIDDEGKLKIKVALSFYENSFSEIEDTGLYTGWEQGRLRIEGVKLFLDGSVGGRTAAFYAPYRDVDSVPPFYTFEELSKKVRFYESNGFKVLIHAIGTRAIDVAVQSVPFNPDFNHRIEHFEFPSKKAIGLVRKKSIHVSMQPNFVRRWSGMYREALLNEDYLKMHPYRTMIEREVTFAFGSDSMPEGPMYGIEGATLHPFEKERLDMAESLQYYTEKSSALTGVKTGAFKKGFFADFVVLDRDFNLKEVYVEGERLE